MHINRFENSDNDVEFEDLDTYHKMHIF